MKDLVRSRKGAVSVFLVLIIVPVFLFQAVLIDLARIKLAEQESERAVKAGVRSVLSGYDSTLQPLGLYGLGLDQQEALALFADVVDQNVSGNQPGKAFRLIDPKPVPDKGRITPMYTIGNHRIFERQILEQMKYRAPIEFSLEIMDKFKKTGAEALMKQGAVYSKEAEAIQKLADKRDEALDEAWSSFESMHDQSTNYFTYYQSRIQELSALAERIGLSTITEVKQSLERVKKQIQGLRESIENSDGTSDSALKDRLQELISKKKDLESLLQDLVEYAALVALTKQEVPSNYTTLVGFQNEIDIHLRQAKQWNDQLRTELERINGNVNAGIDAFNAFKSMQVLEDDFFGSYQAGIGAVVALFGGFRSIIDATYLFTSEPSGRAASANEAYVQESRVLYAKQSAWEEERGRKRHNQAQFKKQKLSGMQDILDQAKKAIGGCSLTPADNGESAKYRKLQGPENSDSQGLYQKYMESNQHPSIIGSGITNELDHAEKLTPKAMSMFSGFSEAVAEVRNEWFIAEYTLSTLNYRTQGAEKDGSGNLQANRSLGDPSLHSLANQEVEYVLYGFSACSVNLASAYGEMFSFRLAIRTLEALMDPQKDWLNMGSPFLVLLAAGAEGAGKTLADMNRLTQGERVELSAKLANRAMTLNYRDYLRIFLLLHPSDEKRLARMQALIELNAGVDLLQKPTYVQGTSTISVRLWFVPGIMKLMDGTGLLDCRVSGNRCQFTKTASLAYE